MVKQAETEALKAKRLANSPQSVKKQPQLGSQKQAKAGPVKSKLDPNLSLKSAPVIKKETETPVEEAYSVALASEVTQSTLYAEPIKFRPDLAEEQQEQADLLDYPNLLGSNLEYNAQADGYPDISNLTLEDIYGQEVTDRFLEDGQIGLPVFDIGEETPNHFERQFEPSAGEQLGIGPEQQYAQIAEFIEQLDDTVQDKAQELVGQIISTSLIVKNLDSELQDPNSQKLQEATVQLEELCLELVKLTGQEPDQEVVKWFVSQITNSGDFIKNVESPHPLFFIEEGTHEQKSANYQLLKALSKLVNFYLPLTASLGMTAVYMSLANNDGLKPAVRLAQTKFGTASRPLAPATAG